jgi:hypothetical protein
MRPCGRTSLTPCLAPPHTQVDVSTRIAANAAAGNWANVVTALVSEYESSVYFPGPAPRGTPLHAKFLAAAAGAIMHGQFSKAQECLKSAGGALVGLGDGGCAGCAVLPWLVCVPAV